MPSVGLYPQLTVRHGVESRLLNGRYRDHANASCSNGRSWWSVHPEALRRAGEMTLETTGGAHEGAGRPSGGAAAP